MSPFDSRITEYRYALYRRDQTGNNVAPPPTLRNGVEAKTVIEDFDANIEEWTNEVQVAIDEIIKNELFLPTEKSGTSLTLQNGLRFKIYYDESFGRFSTFYPEFKNE